MVNQTSIICVTYTAIAWQLIDRKNDFLLRLIHNCLVLWFTSRCIKAYLSHRSHIFSTQNTVWEMYR